MSDDNTDTHNNIASTADKPLPSDTQKRRNNLIRLGWIQIIGVVIGALVFGTGLLNNSIWSTLPESVLHALIGLFCLSWVVVHLTFIIISIKYVIVWDREIRGKGYETPHRLKFRIFCFLSYIIFPPFVFFPSLALIIMVWTY